MIWHAEIVSIQLAKYHATFKISFNLVKYTVQLLKYGAKFRTISCNSEKRKLSLFFTLSHGKTLQVVSYSSNLEFIYIEKKYCKKRFNIFSLQKKTVMKNKKLNK